MWLLLIIDTLMVMDKHWKSYKYPATFLKWFYVCADCVYLRHFAKSRTCTCVCTFLPFTLYFVLLLLLLFILCRTSVSLTCLLLGHTLLHLNQTKLQYIGIESKEHRYFNSIEKKFLRAVNFADLVIFTQLWYLYRNAKNLVFEMIP